MPLERNSFFLQVRFEGVIERFKDQVDMWLEKYANGLKTYGKKDLAEIKKEIDEARSKLQPDPKEIDDLKKMLNVISEILNSSMIMEFRIAEV